jgi:hypothetical protein
MSDASALPAPDDTRPCVGCGMCCDGTLYSRAKVAPGEGPRIEAHGLQLTQAEDRTYFRLPCLHERCGACTIYETRFEVCRTFRCALLRRYGAGEVSLEEANAQVARAKHLLAEATAAEPDAAMVVPRALARARLGDAVASTDLQARRAAGPAFLKIVALDAFLERWFRNKKDRHLDQPG